ncbi:MAG: thioredoxin-disulfide reductase [Deltaproteobacteria bacterium]|nr:thioredoxin-disulfide reductase [Deltaproteobacteria bacterium]MBW2016637.1 thioredoxin-disulfide reductase [Deltaproteobacteria bacterium]MBW2130123.1 thioredoxin-disulfide reductase [Deltaproteobacteria bacterium]MBW2303745.1 thioredoxin-disulfide reductase [Deltaproteobacteria bacterium]
MHDVIIIGGGPAGLTAGLYNARARLDVLLLEKLSPGGQVLTTDWVENYPGFPEGVSGFELMDRMRRQAENFGLVIKNKEVLGLEFHGARKVVRTSDEHLEAKALILACGATPRKLGIEGEDLLVGKGVSYCATCDGAFFRDQEVAVIGGGDTAVEEALFLTRFASKVTLIHRRDALRATRVLQERAMAEEKIEFLWDTVPVKILGNTAVEGIELRNVKTGETSEKQVKGIFVFIGTNPNTELVKGLLELDENGFIVTDNKMESSVPGVFAAGDVRSKLLRQISTAVGEGAAASFSAERYLEGLGSG